MKMSLRPIFVIAIPAIWAIAVSVAAESLEIPALARPWIIGLALILTLIFIVGEGSRSHTATGLPTNLSALDARNQLADTVQSDWNEMLDRLGVLSPEPLPIEWRYAPADLADSRVERHVPEGEQAFTEIFRSIPSRRLVILGRAGAGKTILATRIALKLAKEMAATDPIPVVVSVGSWNPAKQQFRSWLENELSRQHPGLAALTSTGRSLAHVLINTEKILPILDGFEEILESHHRPALEALGNYQQPLIVISRLRRYTAAVKLAGPLSRATVIELRDITPPALDTYLADLADLAAPTAAHVDPNGWQPLLERLRRQDSPVPGECDPSVLRAALSTPLMIFLARTTYGPKTSNSPLELLDGARFPDVAAIQRHLLSGYLAAVYHDRPHILEKASRWLRYHAEQMEASHTRSLGWWQLHALPADIRVIAFVIILFLLGGYVVGAIGGVAAWTLGQTTDSLPPTRLSRAFHSFGPTARRSLFLHTCGGGIFGLVLLLLHARPGAFLAAILVGLAYGSAAALHSAIEVDTAFDTRRSLRTARNTTMLWCAAGAVSYALVTWQAGPLVYGPIMRPIANLIGEFWIGLVLGSIYALMSTAWGRWLATRLLLALTGRQPWRLVAFLDDANERGIIYQQGATYQFRHALLQDHLAEPTSHTPPSKQTGRQLPP